MLQHALIFESGPPNPKQAVKHRPIPEPGPGQVQVRIRSTAINPVDWKMYDHGILITTFPTVLGSDAAGEVSKVGAGVTRIRVGDRILYQGLYNFQPDASNGDKATFQEYGLADVDAAVKIPPSMDYDAASTIPVAAVTAAQALYEPSLGLEAPWNAGAEGLYKGQTLVILGGSSSVGSFAIQFAAYSGFRVLTTSSPAHASYLLSIGADTVLDRSSASLAADIVAAAGGAVLYALDAISSPDTQAIGVDVLKEGGKLVLVLEADAKAVEEGKRRGVQVMECPGAATDYPEFTRDFCIALEGYLERGVIKPSRVRVLSGGLSAWEEAFELHRSGKVSGQKVVLRPRETTGAGESER